MSRSLAAALVLVAAGGCRMCSDSCDYSPPVLNGPYAGQIGRAGSAVNPTKLSPPTPVRPLGEEGATEFTPTLPSQ